MPDIDLVGADRRVSKLVDHIPAGGAVVFFMRASTCPACHAHAAGAVRMAKAGELGQAALIIITPGGAEEAAHVEKRLKSSLATVVASGSAHLNAGLGVTLMLQHSATFVLDGSARVLSARTSTLPTGAFSAAEVRAALAG